MSITRDFNARPFFLIDKYRANLIAKGKGVNFTPKMQAKFIADMENCGATAVKHAVGVYGWNSDTAYCAFTYAQSAAHIARILFPHLRDC